MFLEAEKLTVAHDVGVSAKGNFPNDLCRACSCAVSGYRIAECIGLEGTLESHPVQPPKEGAIKGGSMLLYALES